MSAQKYLKSLAQIFLTNPVAFAVAAGFLVAANLYTQAQEDAPQADQVNPESESVAPPAAETVEPIASVPAPVESTNPTFSSVKKTTNAEEQSKSLEQSTGYSFNPLDVSRDPFVPPKSTINNMMGQSSDLLRFDINQFNLVAIMQGGKRAQAMVVLPNKSSHIVEVGTPVGRRNGKVSKITAFEVTVQESFRDYQNRVRTDQTTLVLAQ